MNYIFFINNKCVFCNACLSCCPTQAIKKNINGFYYIIDSECFFCFNCFYICPVNAIEFYKIKSNMKVDKYVLKNKVFVKKKMDTNFSNFYN